MSFGTHFDIFFQLNTCQNADSTKRRHDRTSKKRKKKHDVETTRRRARTRRFSRPFLCAAQYFALRRCPPQTPEHIPGDTGHETEHGVSIWVCLAPRRSRVAGLCVIVVASSRLPTGAQGSTQTSPSARTIYIAIAYVQQVSGVQVCAALSTQRPTAG